MQGVAVNRPWYRQPDFWLPVGVLLVALVVYVRTLNPTIDFWDCGEFVTVSHIVGVPHQPGTPLYVVVGRVFDVLFGQPDITQPSLRTAWAVNFMSAVFSALAVVMIYLVVVRVARRADPDSGWLARLGGLVGALFLVFSDTFWINAIEAEVYGLAGFMMAMLTWLGLVWYEHRSERRSDWVLLLLIYLCGLGVGFHLGSLLVYPAFFVLVWLAGDRQLPMLDLLLVSAGLALFLASTTFVTDAVVLRTLLVLYALGCLLRMVWPRLRREAVRAAADRAVPLRPFALLGVLLFVAGLSVHAVLMIRAGATPEPAINQTAPEDFDTLLSVIRREQYPPLNPLQRQAPLSHQFQYYYDFLLRQFTFLPHAGPGLDRLSVLIGPLMLAMLGLAHVVRRARPLAWLLVLCYFINAEGLTLYLNFTAAEVRERDYFYFAAFMYAAVFIGLGTAALLRWTSGPLGPTMALLERQAAAPPVGRPFARSAAIYQIVAAFVAALVAMVLLPAAVKTRWLGLFLFGSAFVGFALAPRLAALARPQPGQPAPPAWSERPARWRFAAVLALGGGVVLGAWLLSLFAASTDRVFALGVYFALIAGQLLQFGECRRQPQPALVLTPPPPVHTDKLSWVAAGALIILAALPAVGLLQPAAHQKWFRHDRSQNRIAHEYAYNILAGLDRDAIIFTNGDNDTFPIWYLQEVEHFRRDVTVVNLSLVNLPWYIKQLKRLAQPVDMTYTDQQIDELRWVPLRDRETGEVIVFLVRDFVVKDIIDANRLRAVPRAVYFAVTVPRENMDRYYPFLQMEGLAFRLTQTRQQSDLSATDPDRLLANFFGAYRLDALTTGDSQARHAAFAAQAGWQTDRPPHEYLTGLDQPLPIDYGALLETIGRSRTDIYRDPNTVNLLGNYPVSLASAGFAYLALAEELRLPSGDVAPADTTRYDRLTDHALVAYESALRFDPYSGLVAAGYYPTLLLERGAVDSALSYLESIHGRVHAELERPAVLAVVRGLMSLDRTALAAAWLEARIAAQPAWLFGYELLLRVYENTGEINLAAAVVERWRQIHGEDQPGLRSQLQQLRERAQRQEQDRLHELLQDRPAEPKDR